MRSTVLLPLLLAGCASPGSGTDPDQDPNATPRTTPTEPTLPGGTSTGPDADTDGDGLTDAEEAALGTDPLLPDTDGDGWEDLAEVDGNTDPLSEDDHPYTGGWAIGACRHDLSSTGHDVGEVADDFELTDQFGDSLSLHDFCDREVLMVSAAFW